jgi:hypothetical protein
MLCDNAAYAEKATKVSPLTKDIIELLVRMDLVTPAFSTKRTIALRSPLKRKGPPHRGGLLSFAQAERSDHVDRCADADPFIKIGHVLVAHPDAA